jgi:hypothetical protein
VYVTDEERPQADSKTATPAQAMSAAHDRSRVRKIASDDLAAPLSILSFQTISPERPKQNHYRAK